MKASQPTRRGPRLSHLARPRLSADRRAAGQAGSTLVEVLLAVAILGIVVVALMTGLLTLARSTRIHRNHSNGLAVITSAAEYASDNSQLVYQAGCPSAPPAYTVPSGSFPGVSVATSCVDTTLQKLTLTLAFTNPAGSWTLEVLKRPA